MDIMSTQFLSALLAIIVIDLVLAGDNAIVIALAARNVPKHLQKRAIMWGTVGAIVVRTTLTLVVVALLKIPGLLFVGGLLLVWIAYKLLIPEEEEGGHDDATRRDQLLGRTAHRSSSPTRSWASTTCSPSRARRTAASCWSRSALSSASRS